MALRSWLGERRSAAGGGPSAGPSQRSPKRKQSSCKGCGAGGSAENETDDKRLRRQDGPASLGSPKAENRFNVMLEKVKAYKLRHGHCRVPRDYAEDRVLGRWVSNIRSGNTKTVSPWGKRKGGAAASTDAALEGGDVCQSAGVAGDPHCLPEAIPPPRPLRVRSARLPALLLWL